MGPKNPSLGMVAFILTYWFLGCALFSKVWRETGFGAAIVLALVTSPFYVVAYFGAGFWFLVFGIIDASEF